MKSSAQKSKHNQEEERRITIEDKDRDQISGRISAALHNSKQ